MDKPRTRLDQMLAVVQQQERPLAPKCIDQGGQHGSARPFGYTKLRCNRLRHQVRIGKRSKVDKSSRRLAISPHLSKDRQGQAGLADAANSGQRQEAGGLEQPEHMPTLELTPHEAAQLSPQEVWSVGGDRRFSSRGGTRRSTGVIAVLSGHLMHPPHAPAPPYRAVRRCGPYPNDCVPAGLRRSVDRRARPADGPCRAGTGGGGRGPHRRAGRARLRGCGCRDRCTGRACPGTPVRRPRRAEPIEGLTYRAV